MSNQAIPELCQWPGIDTERPKGEEKFTLIPPEINIISNCFWCNFDEFPTICEGINAIKNIDLG